MRRCVAYIDGGSRGNPGVAGYGVVVQDENGEPVASLSESLGIGTNNFAEYSALIGALRYALANGYEGMRTYADSELMVRQVNGIYKVKSPDLQPLFREATTLIARLKSFSIHHVPREQNRQADRLANLAMDKGQKKETARETASRSRPIPAIFRDGCFHPAESVDLPENTRVHLKISIAEED